VRVRKRKSLILLVCIAILCVGSGVANRGRACQNDARQTKNLEQHIAPIQDMEVAVRVSQLESRELEKIGRDFGTIYRLRNLTLLYKSPDKLRLEGQSAIYGDALLVLNGAQRFYVIPKLKVRKVENLRDSPPKRQSLLEYGGMLSKDTFSFMQGQFVRQETIEGVETQVYDLKYTGTEANSYYRVWLDPRTRLTVKRVWFDSENQVKASFLYRQPREIEPGIWLPGQCEIRNAEGNTGAVLTYGAAKINQNLSDKLFDITP
jgi:outer membrane lipoprotein-sorting protein